MIAVIISVLPITSGFIITPLDVSGVTIINTAVWSSEVKYGLLKQSEPMLCLHDFFGWPSSFFGTELDSTSNCPKVKKGHTRHTRHSYSSFQGRLIPRTTCVQT